MLYKVNDRVKHVKTGTRGRIVDCSDYYGWYIVLWERGKTKEYKDTGQGIKSVVIDLDWV